MANKDTNRETRGENIKVRVTPSQKFAVDFCARITRKSVSQLVTDALLPIADGAVFRGKTWRDYDDPSPGCSFCLMCLDGLPMNKEEDDLKRFILTHRVFFFDGDVPSRRRLDVLWERVPHFADAYFRRMRTDNMATGHDMNKALAEARVKQVKWPQDGE